MERFDTIATQAPPIFSEIARKSLGTYYLEQNNISKAVAQFSEARLLVVKKITF